MAFTVFNNQPPYFVAHQLSRNHSYLFMRILLLFLFLIINHFGFAQQAPIDTRNYKHAVEALKEDLTYLKTNIEEAHPAPFLFISRDSFERAFDEALASIDAPMTETQFRMVTNTLVNSIACSHTQIFNSRNFNSARHVNYYLPFSFTVFEDQLYIKENLSDSTLIELGTPVHAINNMPSDSLVQIFKENAGSEGVNNALQQFWIKHFFRGFFWLWFGDQPEFTISYKNENGTLITDTLSGLMEAPMPFSADVFDSRYERVDTFSIRSNERIFRPHRLDYTAILDIESFDPSSIKYRKKKLYPLLSSRKVRHLIIDIRNNLGGSLNSASDLLQHLLGAEFDYQIEQYHTEFTHAPDIQHPFFYKLYTWFAFSNAKGKRKKQKNKEGVQNLYKITPSKKYKFDGNIYVLMNGGSLSASSFFAAILKKFDRATFIGSETGGTANSIQTGAPVYPFELPNSKLLVQIPYARIYSNYEGTFGRGVLPDYPIEYTAEDYFSGRDLELEKVYELIDKREVNQKNDSAERN